jgi:hypothetical protein
VFNKQQKLIINCIINNYFRIYDTIIVSQKIWDKNKLSIIKCLTKKFKFIIDLEISFIINNQILKIFAKNCKFLTKVKFYGRDIRGFCETFGQKCGQKLELIDIKDTSEEEMISLLRTTPKLKSIRVYDNFEALNERYLPKLEEIKFNDYSVEVFEKFANLYNKQIKKISFDFLTPSMSKEIIPHLSRFENLEALDFGLFCYVWNEDFISMAKNFKKLKRLRIYASEVNQSFDFLKAVNNLDVFELILWSFGDKDMEVIETLNLTQFSLYSKCNLLSDEILYKLSKMKRLSKLCFTSGIFSDSGVCHLIKNSFKLKTIELNDKHINETTIKAFVEKALKNSKTYYKFISQDIFPDNRRLKMRITNQFIPENLLIKKYI